MRNALLISLLIAILLIVISSATFIGPSDDTRMSIGETAFRIHLYAVENNSLPPDLSVLPKRQGYRNKTTDFWCRPLLYSVDENGVLTISSLGADGKIGGEGYNADMSVRYFTKKPDGSFWVSSPDWIGEAEIHVP